MSTDYRQAVPDAASGLIRARSEETVRCCAAAGPTAIHRRLDQLEQEWDIDRVLAAAGSSAVLGGILLGTLSSRKWYALPVVAGGFMLQHALQGSCPPMAVLRQLGVRYRSEIDVERRALYAHLSGHPAPTQQNTAQAHAAQPHAAQPIHPATPPTGDIPATHPTGRPTANDYVETAAGRIKPASQG